MHGLDVRYLNKALLKMLLLMTLHCINIPHKFYTSNLSWSRKNITTDNCLHSLRNLLIACLPFLMKKVLEYTPLQMLMILLFPSVCSNIHNRCLCLHFHPNFHWPHLCCLNSLGRYFLPVGPLYFLEHLFHVDLYLLQN